MKSTTTPPLDFTVWVGLLTLAILITVVAPDIVQNRVRAVVVFLTGKPPPTSTQVTPTRSQATVSDPQIRAMLDTIAYAEGTAGPNGYRTMYGYTRQATFHRHPDTVICKGRYCSSAVGRYQFLSTTWNRLARKLKLNDFSPASQDRAAIELLRESGALARLQAGDVKGAIHQAAPVWASLPTRSGRSYYGQPVRSLPVLLRQFERAGGQL